MPRIGFLSFGVGSGKRVFHGVRRQDDRLFRLRLRVRPHGRVSGALPGARVPGSEALPGVSPPAEGVVRWRASWRWPIRRRRRRWPASRRWRWRRRRSSARGVRGRLRVLRDADHGAVQAARRPARLLPGLLQVRAYLIDAADRVAVRGARFRDPERVASRRWNDLQGAQHLGALALSAGGTRAAGRGAAYQGPTMRPRSRDTAT